MACIAIIFYIYILKFVYFIVIASPAIRPIPSKPMHAALNYHYEFLKWNNCSGSTAAYMHEYDALHT